MLSDIHEFDKQIEREVKNIKGSEISSRNKELILDYYTYNISRDLSKARTIKCLNTLRSVAQRTGIEYEKATRKDYENLIVKLKGLNRSIYTVESYKSILKTFHKWMSGGKEYPECVNWFEKSHMLKYKKLPEELLTEEEVKSIIRHAQCARDKAMIATMWESGARIGELGVMQIKHVVFDELGCRITVDGKTGMRRVRLITAAPYLMEWVNSHPQNNNPDAPLWINQVVRAGQQMHHRFIAKMIKATARRAGIKKPVNPHHFRHSRATYLAQHLTEAQMKEYFGWVQDSDMASRYVHLSGKNMEDAILKLYGLKKEEEIKEALKREPCPRCKESNDVNNQYCAKCWLPLTQEANREVQETEQKDEEGIIAVMKLMEMVGNNPEKVKQAITIMQRQGAGG